MPGGFLLFLFLSHLGGEEIREYGSSESTASALIGTLYDLKQDQKRVRMAMDAHHYDVLVNEFLSSNWNEAVLNRYYRVTRPMYTTQIFIPLSNASRAPKAFGVENVVEPSFWMIHYKGQVVPASGGRWRFWGYGSEVCSVAVDGKTVLASNWIENRPPRPIATPDLKWSSSAPPGRLVHRGPLTAGTWMDLKEGGIVDLDVLIGERAGGNFCAVLLIEKEGVRYEMKDGFPVYPIFQLAAYDTPPSDNPKKAPPFARSSEVWRGIQ